MIFGKTTPFTSTKSALLFSTDNTVYGPRKLGSSLPPFLYRLLMFNLQTMSPTLNFCIDDFWDILFIFSCAFLVFPSAHERILLILRAESVRLSLATVLDTAVNLKMYFKFIA